MPWSKHRDAQQFLESAPWAPGKPLEKGEPYPKKDLLDYITLCYAEVGRNIITIDLQAESGFSWLPFNKLELQLYNIRHLQHHSAQLIDRLRNASDISIPWLGTKSMDDGR
ncbi:MAG: hypothetical protein P1S60_10315 [Anaerolineae bacterium]|nr:hypothetical protein [Anaerolineae bacterium]